MVSPRRKAQFGLISASIVLLLGMITVLHGTWAKPTVYTGLLGSPAAPFRLPDLKGDFVSLNELHGSIVVLCFTQEPNPLNADTKRLAQLAAHYGSEDVKVVAIYSDSGMGAGEQNRCMHELSAATGPRCITLLDPTASLNHRYSIEQTPTFFVIDASGTIRYRGGIDDPSANAPLASVSFNNMIDLLLNEKPVPAPPTPAVLSNIK